MSSFIITLATANLTAAHFAGIISAIGVIVTVISGAIATVAKHLQKKKITPVTQPVTQPAKTTPGRVAVDINPSSTKPTHGPPSLAGSQAPPAVIGEPVVTKNAECDYTHVLL